MTSHVLEPAAVKSAAPRAWLWIEFAVLLLVVPVAHVVFFDTFGPFAPLAAVFIASAILLGLTPDFRWFELIDCRGLLSHIPMTVILIALYPFLSVVGLDDFLDCRRWRWWHIEGFRPTAVFLNDLIYFCHQTSRLCQRNDDPAVVQDILISQNAAN